MANQHRPILTSNANYIPHNFGQNYNFAREPDQQGEYNIDRGDVEDARRSIDFFSSGSLVNVRWPCTSSPLRDHDFEPDTSTSDTACANATSATSAELISNEFIEASATITPTTTNIKGFLLPKKRSKSTTSSSKSNQQKLNNVIGTSKFKGNGSTSSCHGSLTTSNCDESRPESRYRKGESNCTSTVTHPCHECQKVFGSAGKLQQHMYVHSGERPFVCNECTKGFSSRFKLMRHALIHAPPGERRYKCPCCERSFHRKDHLKNHAHVHDPNKITYKCQDCPKEYNSRLSYRKHVAVHAANSGDLECKVCLKRFATTDEIVFHLKVHAGSRTIKTPNEKKFKCEFCERRFFTRKDVKRHLVVHTGRRDFLCQLCPQRFGRKDHLVRHIKKSHHHHHHYHHPHPHPHLLHYNNHPQKFEKDIPTSGFCQVDEHPSGSTSTGTQPDDCTRENDDNHRSSVLFSTLASQVPHVPSESSSVPTPGSFMMSTDMEYKLYEDIKIERDEDDPIDIGQFWSGFLPLTLTGPSSPTQQQTQHQSQTQSPSAHHHQYYNNSNNNNNHQSSNNQSSATSTIVHGQIMQTSISLSQLPVQCVSNSTVTSDINDNNTLPQFDQAFQ